MSVSGNKKRSRLTSPLIAMIWLWALVVVWLYIDSRTPAQILASWDSGWYINIIRSGYDTSIADGLQANVAFFPLYPLLGFIIAKISGISALASLTAASWASLAGCVYLLEKITKSKSALLLVLAQPMAFFFLMPYSESLFLLLSLSAYYFIQREKWMPASLAIAAAGATRVTGVLLLILLAKRLLKKEPLSKTNAITYASYATVSGLGAAIHLLFLQIHTGDALVFLKVQDAWGRTGDLAQPLRELSEPIKSITSLELPNNLPMLVSMGMFFVCLLAAYWLRRNSHRAEAAYIFAASLVPIASGTFTSFSRYSIVLLPFAAIMLADKLSARQRYALATIMLVVQLAAWSIYIGQDMRFVARTI